MSAGRTVVAVEGEDWLINDAPTYPGRVFRGWRIEGLLLNSRMANGVWDDASPLTRHLWAYPDSGVWDPDRNCDELCAALPTYHGHGLRAITVNLQGGSPLGYYRAARAEAVLDRIRERHPAATVEQVWAGLPGVDSQPWASSGFTVDGRLDRAWAARLGRLVEAADATGMVVILGLFYFGQDERLRDEAAVQRAVDEACGWVLDRGFTNVVIEIDNECDIPRYEHAILGPERVHELIARARAVTSRGRRLLAGTSFTRRILPPEPVVAASDFVLLHGNGVGDPDEIAARVDAVRKLAAYRAMPIVYNEDDHYDFEQPRNNFTAALSRHASWGFFDPGEAAGGGHAWGDYASGYQNPPIDWRIASARQRAFFAFLREVAGA